jgi:hypothetical protein
MCNLLGLQMPERTLFHPRYLLAVFQTVTYNTMFTNGCYQSFGDIYKLLHALMPVAIVIMFCSKVYNLIYRDYQAFAPSIHRKTMACYEKYQSDPKLHDILAKRAHESEYYLKLMTFCSFMLFHLPSLNSLVVFLMTGQKFLCVYNFMPFTDPHETVGFIVNLCLLSFLMTTTFLGLMVESSLFVFYGYQVVPLCDILCSHLDEIGEGLVKLKEPEGCEKMNNLEMVVALKNREDKLKKLEGNFIEVIKEHREFENFIQEIIFYHKIPTFFTIAFSSLSIGLSIVVFYKISMSTGTVGGEFENDHF